MFIFNALFRLVALFLLSEIARNASGQTQITNSVSVTLELELSITSETIVIESHQPPKPHCIHLQRPFFSPSIKDCNRAFYNLGFKDGMLRSHKKLVTSSYGGCSIEVRCGKGPINVSAGRLLSDVDVQKSGGYKNLASTCLANKLVGKVHVAGGCSVEVWPYQLRHGSGHNRHGSV